MENKKGGLKDKLKSNKFRHGSLATVFSVIFIALIIVLNVVVSALSDRFPSMNVDLTAEKLNTLSETAIETAKKTERETEIFIIGSEDAIRGDRVFSNYGLQYSQIANLAEKMQEANGKIKVKFIDPDLDPTFISNYPDDALAAGKVLVRTELRYKVLQVTDLYSIQQNQQDGSYKQFSKVDGALSNAVHLTNLENVPVIAVATGHNEMLSTEARASFDQLLKDNNFEVKEFNILTDVVPENAQVIMIPTPETDYSKEEIQKLRDFLNLNDKNRSLLITCNPTQGEMPNLATFLEDWGVKVGKGIVVESDPNKALSNNPSYFMAEITEDIFPGASYPNLLSAYSSPIEQIFKSNNDVVTYTVMQSSDTAYVSVDEKLSENPETGVQITASLSQKVTTVDNKPIRSNVIVFGNTVTLLSDFIGGSSFGNRQFMTDLMKYSTGTSDESIGLYVEQTETNTIDITATASVIHFVGLILFTIIVPCCILIAGLVIFLRRRHL